MIKMHNICKKECKQEAKSLQVLETARYTSAHISEISSLRHVVAEYLHIIML